MSSPLREWIREREAEWIAQLEELVREPSLSAEGRRLEETAALVQRQLEAFGAKTTIHRFPGVAPVVVGTLGEGPRSLLFYNHYDVQPPDPLDEWTVPPFEVTRRGSRLLGRGTADDKGDLVSRMAGVRAAMAMNGTLPVRAVFLVEGEEEIGSPNLGLVVDRLRESLRADACLWESGTRTIDARPVIQAGVKGMCYVELTARAANVDLHSSWGTIVPNAAWRLVWALASLKNERDEIQLDGMLETFRAPDEALRAITRKIPFDGAAYRKAWGVPAFTQPREDAGQIEKHLLEPTCTICGLTSGYQGPGSKTVLPHLATAKLDFRLVPDLTPEHVLEKLRAHLDRRGFTDIEMKYLNGEEPHRSDPGDRVVRAAVAAASEATGSEPVVWPNMGGTGPMAQVCGQLGIPAVGFGVSHAGSRLHAPDENIELEHFLQAMHHVARFVELYAAS